MWETDMRLEVRAVWIEGEWRYVPHKALDIDLFNNLGLSLRSNEGNLEIIVTKLSSRCRQSHLQ